MKITVEWRKTVDGRSTIEIDEDDVWEDESYEPTDEDVKNYLEDAPGEWTDQVGRSDDFLGSEQYEVVGIKVLG